MSTTPGPERDAEDQRAWTKRYPPLLAVGAALVLVVAVLPNSLTLPQSNPTEVPELAPVPPEDDDVPPPQSGNLSTLKLGQSGTVVTQVPEVPKEGIGGNPSIYNCVAGRQTEDPLSPPCSPFFEGDNGGATYQGVTPDEITILVYMDGSVTETSGTRTYDGEQAPVQGTYCDIDGAPNSDEACHNPTGEDHLYHRITRSFSRYFNFRYQTYGRHLHFWLYWSGAQDAGGRRADAADNYETLKPFAVIDLATFGGNNNAYADAMARNGVMVFSSLEAQPREHYQRYNPLVWTYIPDIEHQAAHYVDYICSKVAPNPVAHSGPAIAHGQPRNFGFYYTTDPSWPSLHKVRDIVIPALKKKCGVTGPEYSFPAAGYAVDTGGDPAYARLNVAAMSQDQVTTLLWLGGVEAKTGQAADEQKYYPEVFFMGDNNIESRDNGTLQNQNWMAQVALVTPQVREDTLEKSAGYQAWREAEPNAPTDPDGFWANTIYRDFFMVALGVQVAGPRLHPTTVEQGFRQIPPVDSQSPYLPACFFTNGNFCVQDATHWRWDIDGRVEGGNRPGCYRMIDGGIRYTLNGWSQGDDVFANDQDPCSGFNGGFRAVIRGPGVGN